MNNKSIITLLFLFLSLLSIPSILISYFVNQLPFDYAFYLAITFMSIFTIALFFLFLFFLKKGPDKEEVQVEKIEEKEKEEKKESTFEKQDKKEYIKDILFGFPFDEETTLSREEREKRAYDAGWDEEEMDLEEFEDYFLN